MIAAIGHLLWELLWLFVELMIVYWIVCSFFGLKMSARRARALGDTSGNFLFTVKRRDGKEVLRYEKRGNRGTFYMGPARKSVPFVDDEARKKQVSEMVRDPDGKFVRKAPTPLSAPYTEEELAAAEAELEEEMNRKRSGK